MTTELLSPAGAMRAGLSTALVAGGLDLQRGIPGGFHYALNGSMFAPRPREGDEIAASLKGIR
jgi:hypothetical protein